jgi:hypothetical protein
MEYGVAYFVFSCISISMNAWMAIEMMRIMKRFAIDYVSLVSFVLLPICTWTYMMGQNVIIASCLVVLSLKHLMKENWWQAGAFLGASMVVKPVSIFVVFLVLVWLLYTRRRVELVRLALTFTAMLIPDMVIFLANSGLLTSFINASINGFDMRGVALSISAASLFYYMFDVNFMFVLIPNVVITSWVLLRWVRQAPFEQACVAIVGTGVLLHFTSMVDIWQTQIVFLTVVTPMIATAYRKKLSFIITIAFLTIAMYLLEFVFNIRTRLPHVIVINYVALLLLAIFWYYWLFKLPHSWLPKRDMKPSGE